MAVFWGGIVFRILSSLKISITVYWMATLSRRWALIVWDIELFSPLWHLAKHVVCCTVWMCMYNIMYMFLLSQTLFCPWLDYSRVSHVRQSMATSHVEYCVWLSEIIHDLCFLCPTNHGLFFWSFMALTPLRCQRVHPTGNSTHSLRTGHLYTSFAS